jgi:hypothetical protein
MQQIMRLRHIGGSGLNRSRGSVGLRVGRTVE